MVKLNGQRVTDTGPRYWAAMHTGNEKKKPIELFGCSVPQIPVPSVPTYQPTTPIPQRLETIQKYIRDLQYPPLHDQRRLCFSLNEKWFKEPKVFCLFFKSH